MKSSKRLWVVIASMWGVGLGLVSGVDVEPIGAVGFALIGATVWHAALLILLAPERARTSRAEGRR